MAGEASSCFVVSGATPSDGAAAATAAGDAREVGGGGGGGAAVGVWKRTPPVSNSTATAKTPGKRTMVSIAVVVSIRGCT